MHCCGRFAALVAFLVSDLNGAIDTNSISIHVNLSHLHSSLSEFRIKFSDFAEENQGAAPFLGLHPEMLELMPVIARWMMLRWEVLRRFSAHGLERASIHPVFCSFHRSVIGRRSLLGNQMPSLFPLCDSKNHGLLSFFLDQRLFVYCVRVYSRPATVP